MTESAQDITSTTTRAARGGGPRMLFVILTVLALGGVIVYLLSVLNSKKFFLIAEGGQLLVKKGILFPMGSDLYQDPDEPNLYAPVDLASDQRVGDMMFEDLPSLNREFAKHLIGQAQDLIFVESEEYYQKGKGYLHRASSLRGLDAQQLQQIQAMSADLDYVEAKRAYLEVERSLDRALKKFRQAETFGTGRFQDASDWIRRINVVLGLIREAKAQSRPRPPTETSPEPIQAPVPIPEEADPERVRPSLPEAGQIQ